MTQVKHPSKERLKQYLDKRHRSSEPPPTPEQARRELGWGMLKPERK